MKRLPIFVVIIGIFFLGPIVAQADTVTFTGGAGTTDWNTAGNWSPARVPTQSDDVTIPASQTVTNKPFTALGTGFINSLTLLGTLTIDTSSLTLQSTTATSTTNSLTLTSTQGQYSVLTMQGPTMFKGLLVLSPGQVTGLGAATITGPVIATNGSSLGPASVDNKGSISVPNDGSQVTLGTTSFTNDTTGSIDLEGDGIIIRGSGTFTNLGSITKSTGTETTTFSPGSPFTNGTGATIAADSGTLLLLIVGSSTGAFNANSNATLEFAGVVTLNAGTTFGGSGTIDISAGGVWDVEAPITVKTTNLAFDGETGTIIRGGSNLAINSGTTVTWNSGILGADAGQLILPAGVTMNIVTAGYHGLAMNLDLSGTLNMSADLQLSIPTITIEPKAQFNILTDNSIHGSGATINNGGFFAKTGSTGTSTLDYGGTFNVLAKNAKPVAVNKGTLDFHVSGGTLGGAWTVAALSTVRFSMGNYTLLKGSKFSGGGNTTLSGANWELKGSASVSTWGFSMWAGSTISGAFDLTLLGTSINLGGARTGEIQEGNPVGTIKIPKKNSYVYVNITFTLDACTLDSSSEHFFINQGGVVVQDSAVLLNKGGTMNLDVATGDNTPAIQLSGGTFSNLGTVSVGAGGNLTQTIAGAPWDNSGKLIVQNGSTLNLPQGYVNLGGVTSLPGGFIALGEPMQLESGTLDGTGSIDGSGAINDTGADIEAGSATPGSGTGILSLSVPLTQGTGAAITALISGTTPGTQYDQINSTSSIALGGTLNLQFGKGFTPTPSQSFNILNFSSVTGSFATVNAPTGFTASLKFTATALNVTFTSGRSVSIQPKAASLKVDRMTQFTGTASVGNRVTWRVAESGGGTVTQTGLYTAPGKPGTYHVVVTSVADKTKSDTATVTVTARAADKPTVAPPAAILQPDAGSTPAVVHNTWTSGAPMPTARDYAMGGAIGKNIYVVDGLANGETLAVNEIYNTKTNTWTTGAPDPTARWAGAYAVVNGILYVIGGFDSSGNPLNLVEAYDPVSDSWSTKASMPTARDSITAAVDKGVIYVFGGEANGMWLTTVESYNTATDTWTEEAPMLLARGWAAVGRLGTTIVAADGNPGAPGYTGDNEGYSVTKNKWTELTADPTPRDAGCFSVIKGQLYVAGAWNGVQALTLLEAYSAKQKSWTTLASMPEGVVVPVSAVVGGRLYCIGGDNGSPNTEYNYVQIYQP